MRVDSLRLVLLLIWIISLNLLPSVSCTSSPSNINNNKTERATKSRLRTAQSPWRLVISLSHSQSPSRTDVQRAWEEARLESSQNELEVSYVEGRMTQMSDSLSYPLAFINKFCTDIENGKTIFSLIIGGGSAARFLVTASAALNLPSLWLPMTHRDFLRQGKPGRYETRLGSGSEEAGAAAAALMHKTNWHAFTLLIDTTLLPLHHLLPKDRHNDQSLLPRAIIHLPANDKSLKLRLRRISEEGGSGGVIVIACDLNNARKILGVAGKYHMLNGRFLWLWLDLKAELRPNEPSLLSSHVIYNFLTSSKRTENNPSIIESTMKQNQQQQQHPGNLVLDDEAHPHSLSNLVNDIHRLQEYRWYEHERIIKKREDKSFTFDDDEEARPNDKALNSKTFMPVGMLALRPSSLKISGGDAILSRMLRETSQALDNTFLEYKSSLNRLRETQIKDYFIPTCFFTSDKNILMPEIRANISRSLTMKLRESMRQISHDKAEFQLLNLQAVQFPGNKTQLR